MVLGGLAPLGAFFGSLIAPILINGFGPKGSLLKLGVPLYAISWLGTAFAPTILYIYLTRMIGMPFEIVCFEFCNYKFIHPKAD